MKTFTLDEVKAAFQTLEDHVAKVGADANCTWAIHWAAEDVLTILAGEWAAAEDGGEDEEPATAEARARCPGCDQSLEEIKRSRFACPECYGCFGDEAVEKELLF